VIVSGLCVGVKAMLVGTVVVVAVIVIVLVGGWVVFLAG